MVRGDYAAVVDALDACGLDTVLIGGADVRTIAAATLRKTAQARRST